MADENEDWGKWFRNGSILIVCLLVAFAVAVHFGIGDTGHRGVFGDQFGAINALFSGLGFLGLFLTLRMQSRALKMQSRDLNLQTEALRLQIEEFKAQKEELAKTAEAQQRANQLQEITQDIWLHELECRIDLAAADGAQRSRVATLQDNVRNRFAILAKKVATRRAFEKRDHSNDETKA